MRTLIVRIALLLTGALLFATPSWAQQAATESAPAKPKAAEPAAEAAVDTPPPAATGPTPQRFAPSEEVRADFAVSFPIDI